MTYRMVIAPATGQPPVTRFWFEVRREDWPWWLGPLRGWLGRWRRISRRTRMAVRDREMARGMVVLFADETEMYAMQARLDALDA